MTNLQQEGISPEEMQERTDESSASDAQTGETLRETFGEVIDPYTDEDTIEDGSLIDLTQFTDIRFRGRRINRMTWHLFEQFKPILDDEEGDANNFGLRLKWIFRTKMTFAQESPGNAGLVGDVVTIPPDLWLVFNEVGGWTAMYPEDY